MSENYFTWRSAVAQETQHLTDLGAQNLDAANDKTLQDQYFVEQLTPQQAAERIMQSQRQAGR
ncbi:hypothetical protein K0504_15255 [Neiella marina]|uniref:Uncharacterized protein n=1 Tax=Neiella holothuriorum TaxID=2870530 RepID=A0ABS7EJK3_9GAMM|nr:hypothetical protein [Neiella holothuriorum]MBW8192395.1 hypothetical protein [Neiella holothuriorum]